MDIKKVNLIVAIVSAIITGTLSGIGTYISQDYKYGNNIEKLSKESQSKDNAILELSSKVNFLNSKIEYANQLVDSLTEKCEVYKVSYQDLTIKYNKSISAEGRIITIGSIDVNPYETVLYTGNKLEFKLTSASLFIKIVKVSQKGPIISLAGCENYITENDVKIDINNETCFIIKQDRPLKIRFTIQSCECNEDIDPSIVEEIILTIKDYNIDDQHINLNYSRKFLL